MKKVIIAGIILLILGLIVGVACFAAMGFDFKRFGTEEYETRTTELRGDFRNIRIQGDTAHIAISHPMYPTVDNSAKLESLESEFRRTVVSVEDDTLTIRLVDERRWYDRIGVSLKTPTLTLYLPEEEYGELVIENSTGDISIPGTYQFDSIRIDCSTGDVQCQASAETVSVTTTTGDITLSGLTAEQITANVSTGRVQVSDVRCGSLETSGSTGNLFLINVAAESGISVLRGTGDVRLEHGDAQVIRIQTSTGDVKLAEADAGELHIRTDTGDVTGTLRTEKVFITETDTGKVEVPKSITGGECEITTDTGDIKIEILKQG